MRTATGTLLSLALLLSSAAALAFEVPLELKEHRGKAGPRYVSGGVPLLPGQAKETDALRLMRRDASGRLAAVPAQFRVLARWWRADNSIRWVLVDFQTVMKAGEKQEYVLTDAKVKAPPPPAELTVTETADAITVDTGAAKFSVARKGFSFLSSAVVGGQEMLATTPDCGTVLTDTFGEKYYSSESTRSVEVIEKGPMRVRLRARGLHRARGGKGYSKGMYRYDYLMD
ncbi:MAG: hypothetical protein ACYTGB_12100, partial [Planctomycetota bacterium]